MTARSVVDWINFIVLNWYYFDVCVGNCEKEPRKMQLWLVLGKVSMQKACIVVVLVVLRSHPVKPSYVSQSLVSYVVYAA